MTSRRAVTLFYAGPLIAWMVLIFFMSTDVGSAQTSEGLLSWALRSLAPTFYDSLSPYQINGLNYALRKFGHLSEYAVLTILAVRAIQFGRPGLRCQAFVGALALSVCYAATDEIHQAFSASRTAALRDVLIDTSGAALCMLGILAWFGLKRVERKLQARQAAEEGAAVAKSRAA